MKIREVEIFTECGWYVLRMNALIFEVVSKIDLCMAMNSQDKFGRNFFLSINGHNFVSKEKKTGLC